MASEEVGHNPVIIKVFWLQSCYKSERDFSEQPKFYELQTVLEQSEAAARNYILRKLFYFFPFFFFLNLYHPAFLKILLE